MNEPKTPWPDEKEAHRRFRESQRIGHTQILLKCAECGLEFMIMTWRTGPELAAAFGVYGDIQPTDPPKTIKVQGKTMPFPEEMRKKGAIITPCAEQVICPECATRGRVCVLNYRRTKGSIFEWPKHAK